MKAVLMSIKPKWCELIASGKKTVEVRKTKPKIETPFKVYIYCTMPKNKHDNLVLTPFGYDVGSEDAYCNYVGNSNGKVIGEFVCDYIDYVRNYGDAVDYYDCKASCLSADEIIAYAMDKNGDFVYTYGWHITDLVIYDEPKELSEFHKIGYHDTKDNVFGWTTEEELSWQIKRPPQSWYYVEEG